MKQRSTAYKLSVYITAAIISVFLIFNFIIYRYSLGLMRQNIENNAIGLSSKVIGLIKGDINTTQEVAVNAASQLPYYAQNGGVEFFIRGIIERYPFIQSINIELQQSFQPKGISRYHATQTAEGIIYSDNSNGKLVSFYKPSGIDSLVNERRKGWVEPYRNEFQNKVVAMYHTPIHVKNSENSSAYVGYLTVELSLNYIDTEIRKIKIGKSGFAFLVSSSGMYITHPRSEWILRENIKNLSTQVYKGEKQVLIDALKGTNSGSFTAYPRLLNFKRSWVYYSPITENGWVLLFVMPYSELYSSLRIMLAQIIVLSIASIVILFFLVVYISRRITDPLTQIASEIHQFSTAGRVKTSKNELENLEKSFIQMQTWYKKFKLDQESIHKNEKQIKNDLQQASEIIRKIIPDEKLPDSLTNIIDLSSIYKPANVIGGDLYDYFLIDDSHLLVAIGDVSGKGISAALFMSVTHTLLKSHSSGKVTSKIVNEINKELYKRNKNQYFVTLFLAIIDLKTGVMDYCNAAHATTIILRNNDLIDELTETHGLPLGLYINNEYKGSSIRLQPGDTIFLYTDGITETMNTNGDFFGHNQLRNILSNKKIALTREVVNSVEDAINSFNNTGKQKDDYCMIALRLQSFIT